MGEWAKGRVGEGIGVAIGLGIKWTTCDCCNTETGKISEGGYYDVTVDANISLIIGSAMQIHLPIAGKVGWDIRFVQVSERKSVSCTKNCGERSIEMRWELMSLSGDVGFHGSGGIAVIGGSLDLWMKYGASVDLILKDSCLTAEFNYGGSESGEFQITSFGINYSPILIDRNYQDTIVLAKTCFK